MNILRSLFEKLTQIKKLAMEYLIIDEALGYNNHKIELAKMFKVAIPPVVDLINQSTKSTKETPIFH